MDRKLLQFLLCSFRLAEWTTMKTFSDLTVYNNGHSFDLDFTTDLLILMPYGRHLPFLDKFFLDSMVSYQNPQFFHDWKPPIKELLILDATHGKTFLTLTQSEEDNSETFVFSRFNCSVCFPNCKVTTCRLTPTFTF